MADRPCFRPGPPPIRLYALYPKYPKPFESVCISSNNLFSRTPPIFVKVDPYTSLVFQEWHFYFTQNGKCFSRVVSFQKFKSNVRCREGHPARESPKLGQEAGFPRRRWRFKHGIYKGREQAPCNVQILNLKWFNSFCLTSVSVRAAPNQISTSASPRESESGAWYIGGRRYLGWQCNQCTCMYIVRKT